MCLLCSSDIIQLPPFIFSYFDPSVAMIKFVCCVRYNSIDSAPWRNVWCCIRSFVQSSCCWIYSVHDCIVFVLHYMYVKEKGGSLFWFSFQWGNCHLEWWSMLLLNIVWYVFPLDFLLSHNIALSFVVFVDISIVDGE